MPSFLIFFNKLDFLIFARDILIVACWKDKKSQKSIFFLVYYQIRAKRACMCLAINIAHNFCILRCGLHLCCFFAATLHVLYVHTAYIIQYMNNLSLLDADYAIDTNVHYFFYKF